MPLPHGWIGTTSDWLRGMGIALVVLNLALLPLAWRSLERAGLTAATRGWLLAGVGLVPVMIAFLSFAYGMEAITAVRACGAGHTMTPFVEDLRNVKSDTLAATHFKNRYIPDRQC